MILKMPPSIKLRKWKPLTSEKQPFLIQRDCLWMISHTRKHVWWSKSAFVCRFILLFRGCGLYDLTVTLYFVLSRWHFFFSWPPLAFHPGWFAGLRWNAKMHEILLIDCLSPCPRLWLCTFTLSVAVCAVLLLPISILSNEVLLTFPHSYYMQWLNGSLIHGKLLLRSHTVNSSGFCLKMVQHHRALLLWWRPTNQYHAGLCPHR